VRGRTQAEYLGYLRNSRIGITMQQMPRVGDIETRASTLP
jgi:hypothetical protein